MTHTKANKSKILTLILGLTMCLALMFGIAMASPTSTVYAEGETFEYIEIKGDTDVTSTDGTYKYTASDKTLILNNYNGGQFRLNDDATLVLQGNNVITVNENSHFPNVLGNRVQGDTGVKADKGLTITGRGTLTINVDITKAEERGKKIMAYGITASGDTGSLTIKDNVKITVNINEGGSEYGYAISADQDLSIIENASVDITTVDIAVYSNDGKIIFSGTGEKKIRIDRKVEDWENIIVNAVYASSEDVDISGTGKVLLEAVNGRKIYAMGLPPTIQYGGTSFDTTEFAPIIAPSPILTPGRTVTFCPIQTSLPTTVSPFNGKSSNLGVVFSQPPPIILKGYVVTDLIR